MTENSNITTTSERPRWKGVLGSVAYFAAVGLVVVGVYLLSPRIGTEAGGGETATSAPALTSNAIPGEEPVADAAQVILPSVVHIQTPGGLGSGVIYREDGVIITAAHIVEGAETVRVRFQDGDQVTGEVLGAATDVDIAVVKVDRTDLPPAVFNVTKPRVGQLAVAVGSPFTLESTVTAGIISAVDRTNCPEENLCLSMIQTDAAINPGNSGGALVNRLGEVVGINVSIFSQSGSNEGVGFAVPTETVIAYADGILDGSGLEAAFLGVTGEFATGDRAGALITSIFQGTGAEEAGIRVNDIVIALDGVLIQGLDDLAAQVRAHRPGDTVTVTLLRDGEELSIDVTLGIRPESS